MSNNKPVSTEAFANFMRKSIENDHIAKTSILRIMDQMELDQIADSEDITVNREDGAPPTLALTDRAKRALFDEMWVKAGKIYSATNIYTQYSSIDRVNHPDAPYILNDIALTYEEALEVYDKTAVNYEGDYNSYFSNSSIKTNFPIPYNKGNNVDFTSMFSGCKNLEVAVINANYANPNYANNLFSGCVNLREIRGTIQMVYAKKGYWNRVFEDCVKLEEIRMQIRFDMDFHWSPELSFSSVQYFVANSAGYASATNVITITVHDDVYAKLTGDYTNEAAAALPETDRTKWVNLLTTAIDSNISFATV